MSRVEQTLHEILLMGIDPEPHEVLMLKARAVVEKFKADSAAFHQRAGYPDTELRVAGDLAQLRDAVDREIDRRLDEDLVDSACDLLEHLSGHLSAQTGASGESTSIP